MRTFLLLFVLAGLIRADEPHAVLPIGSPAPNFALTGIDGKVHHLDDYAKSKILLIVFTCNHCPTAQLYERRIQKLADDYAPKGVKLVAIEPNNAKAVRLDELGYTDVSDSLADMKIRAEYRHFTFPYLYDGETQATANAYGPQATPHVFIFDEAASCGMKGGLITISVSRWRTRSTRETLWTHCGRKARTGRAYASVWMFNEMAIEICDADIGGRED